jgi:hypothetical protein
MKVILGQGSMAASANSSVVDSDTSDVEYDGDTEAYDGSDRASVGSDISLSDIDSQSSSESESDEEIPDIWGQDLHPINVTPFTSETGPSFVKCCVLLFLPHYRQRL